MTLKVNPETFPLSPYIHFILSCSHSPFPFPYFFFLSPIFTNFLTIFLRSVPAPPSTSCTIFSVTFVSPPSFYSYCSRRLPYLLVSSHPSTSSIFNELPLFSLRLLLYLTFPALVPQPRPSTIFGYYLHCFFSSPYGSSSFQHPLPSLIFCYGISSASSFIHLQLLSLPASSSHYHLRLLYLRCSFFHTRIASLPFQHPFPASSSVIASFSSTSRFSPFQHPLLITILCNYTSTASSFIHQQLLSSPAALSTPFAVRLPGISRTSAASTLSAR